MLHKQATLWNYCLCPAIVTNQNQSKMDWRSLSDSLISFDDRQIYFCWYIYACTFLRSYRRSPFEINNTFQKHLLGYDLLNEIKAKVSLNSKTFYAQFSVDHLHGPSKNDRAASWVFHEQLDGLSHRNSILIPTANVWASEILLQWKICGNSVAVLVFSNLFSHRFKLHAT